MHSYVHCSTIHYSQDMEQPKCLLTDEWIEMGIHTQWNITPPLKRKNNAICSNMDGTIDSHTK